MTVICSDNEINLPNIFLLIEKYLANPTKKYAEKIKHFSHEITNDAYESAKTKFSGKRIGADEYSLILMDAIAKQAEDALNCSARLITNSSVSKEDPTKFIFKINKEDQQKIKALIGEMLQGGKNSRHPDGLIFAYDGYIERRKTSHFKYCDDREDLVYKNNVNLTLKSFQLEADGSYKEAEKLRNACSDIKNICCKNTKRLEKCDLDAIYTVLEDTIAKPEMKVHRGIKEIVLNFMIAVTGIGLLYLANTAESRGSFWYHPNTDREQKIMDFEKDVEDSYFFS
jgi:hypothetical protein